ncbi:MAG TPA: hypothetical protein VKJ45_22770 [Blastocatellia bacterium]|nr:hypothetical protein [Blastocatellia bacterium]
MRLLVAVSVVCAMTVGVFAGQSKGASLDDLKFLVGEWRGEGDGKPGQAATGGFSFNFELQGKVLVRRNFAEYAATQERPAFRHDDLMIVYEDSNGRGLHASYYDSEGHTIQYAVAFSPDKRTLTFISDPSRSAPRYRFIFYRQAKDDLLNFEFDIAPPGNPDAFSKYIDGKAVRK